MRKWVKRILLSTAALLTIAAGLSYWLFQGQPDWYQPRAIPAEQREALAQRAEEALIGANNWADQLKARTARQQSAAAAQNDQPLPELEESHSVAFTEDELNALFQKWSKWNGWDQRLAKYVTDPVIALRGESIVLAGKINDIGAVASFYFKPQLDDNGQIKLTLSRVLAGRLPMPKAIWNSQRDRMAGAIQAKMPAWQQGAALAADGSANQDLIAASFGQAMIDVLSDRPAEANVFIQGVPMRVTDLKVAEEQLGLTVVPLNASERTDLLQRVQPDPAGAVTVAE